MTMADVRCPMCSTINPADATACSVCGARLKPMIAGEAESLAGPPEPPDGRRGARRSPPERREGGAGDCLARIRREGERKAEPSGEAPPRPGEPEWLNRLRPASGEEEGPPEGELPEWLSEEEGSAAGPSEAAPGE